ncbi:MAG: hypothetical protein CO189_12545 [candidate division Zixibacteria bacterium CG_4_9_14_3_um_filter_46_8]|nr:MAG: hypothetical protein CO189_12545 [candidate division Zixibacteria bacterium CG_4_9_14_3_um_filter_46_8]
MPVGYHLFGKGTSIPVIFFALLVALYIDLSRIFHLPGNGLFLKLIGSVLREHEANKLSGASYILLSGLIAIIFLDVPNAAAVMGFVILGDIAAALTGRRIGRIKLPGTNKTFEGSLGCLLVCIIVAMAAPGIRWETGLAGAVTATIAEAYSGRIDDNLAVAIVSGLSMILTSWLLQ